MEAWLRKEEKERSQGGGWSWLLLNVISCLLIWVTICKEFSFRECFRKQIGRENILTRIGEGTQGGADYFLSFGQVEEHRNEKNHCHLHVPWFFPLTKCTTSIVWLLPRRQGELIQPLVYGKIEVLLHWIQEALCARIGKPIKPPEYRKKAKGRDGRGTNVAQKS